MTDTLPPEIRVPVYTPSAGSYDPATGVWAGLSLGPSQSVTLGLVGTVDPWARGTLVNSVRVDPPDGVTDPDPSNDSATVADTLMPSADLALAKAGDVDPADLGGLLTYTLTVTNNGPSAATGVVLTDPLPADHGARLGDALPGHLQLRRAHADPHLQSRRHPHPGHAPP